MSGDEILHVVAGWRRHGEANVAAMLSQPDLFFCGHAMADWIEAEADQRKRDRQDAERGRWLMKQFVPGVDLGNGVFALFFENHMFGRSIEDAVDKELESERKERGE